MNGLETTQQLPRNTHRLSVCKLYYDQDSAINIAKGHGFVCAPLANELSWIFIYQPIYNFVPKSLKSVKIGRGIFTLVGDLK